MARAARFIIQTSDGLALTCWTHSQAWQQAQEIWRRGLTVTCTDTEARNRAAEEQKAIERPREANSP